jgi:hypothetical protein
LLHLLLLDRADAVLESRVGGKPRGNVADLVKADEGEGKAAGVGQCLADGELVFWGGPEGGQEEGEAIGRKRVEGEEEDGGRGRKREEEGGRKREGGREQGKRKREEEENTLHP